MTHYILKILDYPILGCPKVPNGNQYENQNNYNYGCVEMLNFDHPRAY